MISVIVPVYNVKPYLEPCILSILNQQYDDFECILINDGSTDGSEELCNELQLLDSRIQIIHQSNQGVSAARNRGLDTATGEHVAFIDSVDWIDTVYLQRLWASITSYQADLSACGLIQECKNGENIVYKPARNELILLSSVYFEQFILLKSKFHSYGSVI